MCCFKHLGQFCLCVCDFAFARRLGAICQHRFKNEQLYKSSAYMAYALASSFETSKNREKGGHLVLLFAIPFTHLTTCSNLNFIPQRAQIHKYSELPVTWKKSRSKNLSKAVIVAFEQ